MRKRKPISSTDEWQEPPPYCEICGTHAVYQGWQDLREIEPITGKDGNLWARYERVIGSQHYRCKEHWTAHCIGKIIKLEDQKIGA